MNIETMIMNGGIIIWILIAFSIIATTITLVKLWAFSKLSTAEAAKLSTILENHQGVATDTIYESLQHHKYPSIEIIRAWAHKMHEESALIHAFQQAEQHIFELGRHLKTLEVLAMTAPLLGLLGTVLGMIVAFQAMEQAGAQIDPSVLSGGIWQALLTTAAGLIVAIPILMVHQYFERRLESHAHHMNHHLQLALNPNKTHQV